MDGASIVNVISQCMRQLNKMQDLILQRVESTNSQDKEILGINSSVVYRLQMLFEDPTGQSPPSPILVDGTRFPTAEKALMVIYQCNQSLLRMRQLVIQPEKSLPQGESVDNKVLRNHQSSVVCQLKNLIKEPEETDDNEEDYSQSDSDDDDDDDDGEAFVQRSESVEQEKFRWSSEDGMKGTNGRYLCLSNGFEIWCLDLKQSRNTRGIGPLPKIASLNLLGGQLPASLGLFNLGPRAYVIGGKELPASLEYKDLKDAFFRVHQDKKTKGMEPYSALAHTRGVRGSSCLAHKLSLVAGKDDCILSPIKLSRKDNINKLNKPKFWPIVEKIGQKLHVIDSLPLHLEYYYDQHKASTFSHEVCNMSKGGWQWEEIETLKKNRIDSYVVVGDRIYAVTPQGVGKDKYDKEDEVVGVGEGSYFLEFDSLKWGWKRCERPVVHPYHASKMKHVWNIISLGIARCAGEFPHPHEKLFVLVVIMRAFGYPDFSIGTLAVAYLVTSKGQVLCYQLLPEFFVKDQQLLPCSMIAGTMIHVDEAGHKGTMCSVFSATLRQDGKSSEHLFVNTFSVKMRSCVADKVQQILVEKARLRLGHPSSWSL